MTSTITAPRVWLVAGLGPEKPVDRLPVVRDDQLRVWHPTSDGFYVTGDGRHRASWAELHARYDLVEVS